MKMTAVRGSGIFPTVSIIMTLRGGGGGVEGLGCDANILFKAHRP